MFHHTLRQPQPVAPKRKFKVISSSFMEGSENIRHLPRDLSIQRNPEFFSAYHHWDHVSRLPRDGDYGT